MVVKEIEKLGDYLYVFQIVNEEYVYNLIVLKMDIKFYYQYL